MSHHPEESGIVPDDRLLVRPYVVPAQQPAPATAPAWPRSGPPPVSFHVPEVFQDDAGRDTGADAVGGDGAPPTESAPHRVSGAHRSSGPRRAARRDGRDGGRRPPVAALALLALGLTGALVYLLSTPDEADPSGADASPGLTLPVPGLLAGGQAGAEPSPDPSLAGAKPTPSASVSASASATPGPASAKPGPASSAPAGQPAAGTSGTLRMGDSGEAVRALQERLHGQGFTYVSTTGVYDSQTKRGVAQLQRDRGIKGDQPGVYGPATQAALGGAG
ncbi:peptidoglycan-binding protein [Streptomyces sp. NBC_01408]|uniref:peptidoglycan-binding domain-containing protein n=1 Tax=Streptomyces sp. NBC_01408 TaxID=2903855 RepID=UPI002255550E|nr:peptidoglycan-binding domain-containing protein [Streptomyces sp. NBC_01408]MCX4695047.1 peptidoglycan-binding protein [Streptomyces sp. NBC_01408]